MSEPENRNPHTPQPEGPILKSDGSLTPEQISKGIRDRLTAAGEPQEKVDAASNAAHALDSNQSVGGKAWFGSAFLYTWLYVQADGGPKFSGNGVAFSTTPGGVSGGTIYTANGYTLAELYDNTAYCSFGGVGPYFTVEFWGGPGNGTLYGSFQGGGIPNVSAGSFQGFWE